MEHYLSLAIKAIFVENMALAFFLGMCSFLAVLEEGRDGDRPRRRRDLRADGHRAAQQPDLRLPPQGGRARLGRRFPGRLRPLASSGFSAYIGTHRGHGADRRDGARSLRAGALQRARRLPAADRGELRDPRRLALHGGARLHPRRERGLRLRLRARLGAGDRRAGRDPREHALQQRARRASRPRHHLHRSRACMAIGFMAFAGIQL